MAFQTGTRVRPELGRANVSGFAAAGENIGAGLLLAGKAVAAHRAKKAKAEEEKQELEITATMLDSLADNFEGGRDVIGNLDEAKVFAKTLGAKGTLQLLQSLSDIDITPVSTGAIAAAETEAEAQGYEFNPETGKYEKKETEAGFFGTLGNILMPGRPFGVTETREMSQEMLQGITGMEQSQRIRAAEEGNPGDPMGILD
jgi:hypothetical protein